MFRKADKSFDFQGFYRLFGTKHLNKREGTSDDEPMIAPR